MVHSRCELRAEKAEKPYELTALQRPWKTALCPVHSANIDKG